MFQLARFFVALSTVLAVSIAHAETLNVYIDADYTIESDAAEAIELGVRTALADAGHELGEDTILVVARDHRGNSKRSLLTIRKYLADRRALAVIGGLHSPPYLTYREYINRNEVLLLLPWSAAGPITRAKYGEENWIFRLSVDDSKAGPFLVDTAVGQGCQRIALTLIDTGWGRANRLTMTDALARAGRVPADTIMFSTQLGAVGATEVVGQIKASGADCVILLSHTSNAKELMPRFAEMPSPPRVFSHWGILGKRFSDYVPYDVRAALRLQVLQTCGLKVERSGSKALDRALELAGWKTNLAEVPAPAGFVHGYDLTLLLISAIKQAQTSPEWEGDVAAKRRAVRAALEDLREPTSGILGVYTRPYSPYRPSEPDAHEALGADKLCMARFEPDGRLADVE